MMLKNDIGRLFGTEFQTNFDLFFSPFCIKVTWALLLFLKVNLLVYQKHFYFSPIFFTSYGIARQSMEKLRSDLSLSILGA